MAIVLTPEEIPKFWEAIKFATVNFDFVEEEYRPGYLNRLLYQLLSGKAQCFVRLSKDRRLEMIAITKITMDEIRDERILFGVGIFSFNKVDISVWNRDLNTVIEFAKANKCKFISTWVVNEKAPSLLTSIGFKHRFDRFLYWTQIGCLMFHISFLTKAPTWQLYLTLACRRWDL